MKHRIAQLAAPWLLGCIVGCTPRSLGSYEIITAPEQGADASAPSDDAQVPEGDTAEPPTCTEPCDDGLACNGLETCEEGQCQPGTPPCQNPDPVHCESVCEERSGVAVCSAVGKDDDRDAHRDQACEQAAPRGDDCADDAPAVHGGADELCDGVDNDCDGQLDFADGLPLPGETRVFGPGRGFMAAGAADDSFGVVFEQDGKVFFDTLDHKGNRRPGGEVRVDDAVDPFFPTSTSITWGGDEFAVTWARPNELGFRRVTEEGLPVGAVLDLTPENYTQFGTQRVVRVGPEHDWLTLFECCGRGTALHARRITPEGVLRGPHETVADDWGLQLGGAAVSGDQLGLVWWSFLPPGNDVYSLEWSRRRGDLTHLDEDGDVLLAQAEPPATLRYAVIAATPAGFAIAWTDSVNASSAQHLRFAEFDREGKTLCGPLDLSPYFPVNALPLQPTEMVPTGDGVLLAGDVWSASDERGVDLVEVRSGCRYMQRFRVATTSAVPTTALARAANSILVLWEDHGETGVHILQRTLDAHLCPERRPR